MSQRFDFTTFHLPQLPPPTSLPCHPSLPSTISTYHPSCLRHLPYHRRRLLLLLVAIVGEELGLTDATVGSTPLAPPHPSEVIWGDANQHVDREFVTTFRAQLGCGQPVMDPAEVAEIKWISLAQLQRDLRDKPGNFTPWFRREAEIIGIL